MLSTGSNPTLVTNYLHSQHCYVKPRDVFNLKAKLKFQGTPLQEIQSELQKPGIKHVITKDDNDVLQCVAFCTEHQQQLAAKYGGVVLLDGTYRINKFRMPLYTLAVVDSEGHGQPIAHALVAREDVAHITMFLDSAREWFPSVECAIFIVDKDYAEINAINAVFPDASIHLCRFHVLKAFLEEMKRQSLQRDHTLYKVL